MGESGVSHVETRGVLIYLMPGDPIILHYALTANLHWSANAQTINSVPKLILSPSLAGFEC
jgi:hypothetical protein